MKRVHDPIRVAEESGRPRMINWSGRTYLVRSVEADWTTPSSIGPDGKPRRYFRVGTHHGVLHIFRVGDDWYLSHFA